MCGLSGSGKSTVAAELVCQLSAIRIRSDLERKRLHDIAIEADSGSDLNQGIYSTGATDKLYGHLEAMTRELTGYGLKVIIDAAFLQKHQRQQFRQLAQSLNLPFFIVCCQAEAEVLRDRVLQRSLRREDPSEADIKVLEYQLRHIDLPDLSCAGTGVLSVDTGQAYDCGLLSQQITQQLGKLGKSD